MVYSPIDLRQSPQYGKYLKAIGWMVEKIGHIFIFIRKIPLTPFSIIKIQRPSRIPSLRKIEKLAKKYRAISISIEPSKNQELRIKNYGYKLSNSPYLPTKTIQLDLGQSEKKILIQMKKDTRYCLKKISCLDYNILIYDNETEKEIKNFYQAWKKAAGWRLLIPSFKNILALKTSFGQNALFLVARQFYPSFNRQGFDVSIHRTTGTAVQILAGTIILIAGKTAYYYYAFTSKKGRKLLAQYGLIWEAIKRAKKLGCRIFDLEGIYDPRFPQKAWLGFTHFKKSFGGKEIKYPGCFRKSKILKSW